MVTVRTDIVLAAKAEGFQKVQQEALKLGKQAEDVLKNQTKGFQDNTKASEQYSKELGKLEGALEALTQRQLGLVKSLKETEKGTNAYKELAKALKNTNKEAKQTEQLLGSIGRIQQRPQQRPPPSGAQGAFSQGLVQGAMPGNIFLQRGPGMRRQAAGMAIGGMARGFGGAAFGGVQGAVQGLAGIPMIGGFLAGQMSTGMGYAKQSLGVQQARLSSLAQYGGGAEAIAGIKRSRGVTEGMEVRAYEAGEEAMKGVEKPEEVVASRLVKMSFPGERPSYRTITKTPEEVAAATKINEKAYTKERADAFKKAEDASLAGQKAQRIGAARRRPFADIRAAGERFGVGTEAQALQMAGGIMSAGGGGTADLRKQGLLETSFAAQQIHGVGAGVSGAFLQAGRIGGAVGAEGRGGDAMVDVLSDAVKLGLEGSEVKDYMQQMASGIQSFKDTGIPINTGATARMSMSLAESGIGGVRGAKVAGGIAGAARGVAKSGVQTSVDMLMLRTLGGYKGGGLGQYQESIERMETGGFVEGGLDDYLKQLGSGKNQEVGLQKIHDVLGIGMKESRMLQASVGKRTLSSEEQAVREQVRGKLRSAADKAPKTPEDLIKQSDDLMKNYGRALQKQIQLQNRQADLGSNLVKPMQALEASSLNINKVFVDMSKETIGNLAKKIEKFTGKIPEYMETLEDAVSALERIAALKFG